MKKIVFVWIGNIESEDTLYKKYITFGKKTSKFAVDANIEFYDEDFMESWWCEKLEITKLAEEKNVILDGEYFYDDLINELKGQDISNYNTIFFMFGSERDNDFLFDFTARPKNEQKLKFVYSKIYRKTNNELPPRTDKQNFWQTLKCLFFSPNNS